MLKRLIIAAAALAAFAVFDDSAAQIVTLNYTENDPRFQTEQPCQAFGGTVIALPDGKKICKDIDSAGTFCIIGSKTAFPCKGLYTHVTECNREYNRTAHSPFFCGTICRGDEKPFARGKKCVKEGFQCTTPVLAASKCDDYNLFEVARFNIASCAQLLINNGKNVNYKYSDGETPLHIAAARNSCQVATILLQNGATIHAKNDIGDTPLHNAADYNAPETAELLLEYGADVNARKNADAQTPLIRALNNSAIDHSKTISLLLEHGADANVRWGSARWGYWTPLHYLAFNNDSIIGRKYAELLLQYGANPNARTTRTNHTPNLTPLHETAHHGNLYVAEPLLQHGANVNAKNGNNGNYNTPLHVAVDGGDYQVAGIRFIEFLLQNGANVNALNAIDIEFARTPLDIAISHYPAPHESIVSILRQYGGVCNKYC